MEKIGDFARRCQTTIKTLRYYDQLGLLVPDHVDAFSGYRYYGPGKMAEMRRITELKDIGFTLDEIKRYCEAAIDERGRIIDEKHWALSKQAGDIARQLQELEKIQQSLQKRGREMAVDADAPFENDERVVGRWEFVATVPKKEYFKPEGEYGNTTMLDELYFLPQGEKYWTFGWTKGYVIVFVSGSDERLMLPYELDEVDGQTFMFVAYPSYGGIWVLRQTDRERHSAQSIARNDDVDLPFVDDPAVHGLWVSVHFVDEMADFDPNSPCDFYLAMQSVAFLPDGVFEWTWQKKNQHRWTKGKALIKSAVTTRAPAYHIRIIDGVEYLFFEHKSGDYTWGKMKPKYYVLRRAQAVL